ncbi:hypothetical protein MGLY_12160 [Neomoorella glycerini]|uniref:Periplasmic binding protein-like I n=1 Tax=Neomoorella glycerini TaxID=55779 RepID=A0A6I5ZPM3_9FIRM|nr:hypothetical protein [Moorella glycerini]QGP91873.1 hypothetical protein MGLY_12160 [Moorella glycerini]
MKLKQKGTLSLIALLFLMLLLSGCSGSKDGRRAPVAQKPIKVGIVTSLTGALETYGKATINGFELGLEYATQGKKEVAGRPVAILTRVRQLLGKNGCFSDEETL